MTTFHSTYQPPAALADDTLTNWQPSDASRVHTGALRHGPDGVQVTEHGSRTYQAPIVGTVGSGVSQTLQSRYGPATVELEPGNPHTRTKVETAIRMGLVSRSSDGKLSDVVGQQQAREAALAEPEEAPQVDPGAGLFSECEDRAFAQLIDPLPQHAYDGALASMVSAVAHGRGTENSAALKLAEAAGIDPGQAAEMVASAHAHYSRVVARALAPLGLTGARLDGAYSYMQDSHPARLQEAIQRLTHGRDVSMFKELAQSYLAGRK